MFAIAFPEIVFRGAFPGWLAILLVVVGIGVAIAFYLTESMRLGTARRLVLSALRAVVFASIIFLLCKPVLVRDIQTEKPRPVVLLADNSQSMTQKDPRQSVPDRIRVALANDKLAPDNGLTPPALPDILTPDRPTRAEVVKAAFQNRRLDLLAGLRKKGPIQPYLFGSRTRGFPDTPENPWLASLAAEDTKTQLTDTIHELFQRDENDLPAAIVLVTDGRDNGSTVGWDDVAEQAAKLNIPSTSTPSAVGVRLL